MGSWYDKDGIKISLYSRSQHHGNHNCSHFHVMDHGDQYTITWDGTRQRGHGKNEKKVIMMIQRNKDHILKQIDRLDKGLDCQLVNDSIDNK